MATIKNSEYLFFLVKSLSKSEKRFFTLASKFQSGDKIYSKVFNALEKMQEYDEEILLKKIGWDKLPEAEKKRKLSVTKNYLYNQILKSLRTYSEKESIDVQLHNLILDIETLRAKGLYSPALKRLAQAKKTAIEHEKLLLLLDILSLEINLIINSQDKKVKETIEQRYVETNDALRKLEQQIPFQQLNDEMFVAVRLKSKEVEQQFVKKMEDLSPSEKQINGLDAFYAKSNYYSALASYYLIKQNAQKAYEYRLKIVELWRNKAKIRNTRLSQYTIFLSNYLQSCHKLMKYEEFPVILEEIAALPIRSQAQSVEIFQNVHYLELLYYMNTDKFHKATQLVPKIEAGFKQHSKEMNKARLISFYYNLTILFFALKDYKNAWKWLDKILYGDKSDVKKNIQEFSDILQIVIHLEQNNDQVVNHIFNSYKKTLKNIDPNSFQSLALRHLKKIARTPAMRKELYLDFKKDIDQFIAKKKPSGIEELSIWVETKITNKSFIEILRERNEKRK